MRKILFGTIVFFSLAFLASCGGGGSGSKGATGATGATGAAGADGTSGTGTDGTSTSGSGGTVPSADADLALTASLIDSDLAIGAMATRKMVVSGMDNYTSSRVKYYGYLGASSTTKSAIATPTNVAVTGGGTAWPLADTGIVTAFTLTPAVVPGVGVAGTLTGDGITHLILCPGNEAGDAITCASAVLEDRGLKAAVAPDSGVDMIGDNPKVFVLPVNSSTGHAMVLLTDNMTHLGLGSLTETKITNATYTSVLAATANNKGSVPAYMNADNVTDAVMGGTTLYTTAISTVDNGSILIKSISSTGTIATYDTVAGNGTDNISDQFMLSWDPVGSALYGAGTRNGYTTGVAISTSVGMDNRTVMTYALDGSSSTFSDNFTIDNVTTTGGAWCFAAGSPKWSGSTAPAVLVAARDDNSSWMLMTDTASDLVASSSQMQGTETLQDNSTGGHSTGGVVNGYIDNATALQCDIAWNFSTSSSSATGQDNGTIHFAMTDNASSVRVGIIAQDNATTEIGGILAATGTGVITDIEVGVDSGDNKTVLAIVKGASYYLLKENAASDGFDSLGTAVIGGTKRNVSLNVTADGTAYAIAMDGGSDNASIRIFYDN